MEPFVYPGVSLEPSMYLLYDKNIKGRFRQGNQYTTNEWNVLLSTIAWNAVAPVKSSAIQSSLQAELGFHISKYDYTIKQIIAMQKEAKSCIWYATIETDELDDLVVLKITMERIQHKDIYRYKSVGFLGYQPQDMISRKDIPKHTQEETSYHIYGTNFLHRNQLPGSYMMDRGTIHTIGTKDHTTFSSELDSNWPTLLHPDST